MKVILEIRTNCECCNKDLPPESREATICSFECTFCLSCAQKLEFNCPNCGGEMVRRPPRAVDLLDRYPASATRVFKPEGCKNVLDELSRDTQ